jgi:hypothetical protein
MNAIIAVNPLQMQEAQATTISWVQQKIEGAALELREAEQVAASLSGASLRRTQASNLISKARVRLKFYEKVKAALDAGFYIVPPFPLQLFAIRTDRPSPPLDRGETTPWGQQEHTSRSLPVGAGKYVSPETSRHKVATVTKKHTHNDGTHEVAIYENAKEWGDVVLPVRALKPQIIDEVGKALEARIFDALGIAPAYRASDPIICGEIKKPGGGVLTFFVAWWLDERDL